MFETKEKVNFISLTYIYRLYQLSFLLHVSN